MTDPRGPGVFYTRIQKHSVPKKPVHGPSMKYNNNLINLSTLLSLLRTYRYIRPNLKRSFVDCPLKIISHFFMEWLSVRGGVCGVCSGALVMHGKDVAGGRVESRRLYYGSDGSMTRHVSQRVKS